MPIAKKWLKTLRSMSKTYCKGNYDKTVDGVPTCPKSRSVFYATMKKKGIDYTKGLALEPKDVKAITPKVFPKKKKHLSELSEKELLELAAELLVKEREEE